MALNFHKKPGRISPGLIYEHNTGNNSGSANTIDQANAGTQLNTGGTNNTSGVNLYFSLNTNEGTPVVCDVYVYGYILN